MEKIKPSDLQAEAQRLLAAGKMPKLEDFLNAIAETREKYSDRILAAGTHAGVEALKKP